MTEPTPIRRGPASLIPPTMHDRQGANGWEWRMVWQLRKMAGDAAIRAMAGDATHLTREFWQFQERLLDQTADRIAQELPEIRDDTPEQIAARRPPIPTGASR